MARSKKNPDPLFGIEYPEIFIGIVGPIGTDIKLVCEFLATELKTVGYKANIVRVSDILKNITGNKYPKLDEATADARYKTFMQAGTFLRERTKRGDILALLSLDLIKRSREVPSNSEQIDAFKSNAYIFYSLKHPDEIQALRDVYGRQFYVVSAYSPETHRLSKLMEEISSTRKDGDSKKHSSIAQDLINVDYVEEGKRYGQKVGGAFPYADYFVKISGRKELSDSIKRFVRVVFDHPFETPTPDEVGMALAKIAALRSADLSRQVGAVISTSDGQLLAAGCNEVPKGGGGAYWPGANDQRDFQRGYDSSGLPPVPKTPS